MDTAQNQVEEFHRAFGHPIGENGPQLLTLERAQVRAKWMREEVDEFIEAIEEGRVDKAADAMADLRYFAIGTDVEMGVDGQQVFDLVHRANMQKLHNVDGTWKAVFDDDGKVVKPEGWTAPDERIAAELEAQRHIVFMHNVAVELSHRDLNAELSHNAAADLARLTVSEVADVFGRAGQMRAARNLAAAAKANAAEAVLVASAGLGGSNLGSAGSF